jgi:hypothetical protein
VNDQVPISLVCEDLLPRDLRAELCIAGIAVDGGQQLVRFRIDPGGAFQRGGFVRSESGARFLVGVTERYLPDGPRQRVGGSDGVPAGDVPDQLRAASGWAYTWDRDRDHWRDARPAQSPPWAGSSRDIIWAARAAEDRARHQHITHYVYLRSGKFAYGNNPPLDGTFFSVTKIGDWSLHQGRETYPLDTAPDTGSAVSLTSQRQAGPARLARLDQTATEGLVLPFRSPDVRRRVAAPPATQGRHR